MKKLYTLLFLITPFLSVAQFPAWTWAKSGGGPGYEFANDIATDVNGNVYLVGGFKSDTAVFGSVSLANSMQDSLDIFITKYDANGTVLWSKRFGGPRNDEATSVALDPNGDVTLVGYIYSSLVVFGPMHILGAQGGYSDAFIAKLDPGTGQTMWATDFGGQYDDQATSVAFLNSQQAVVTGFFLADTVFMGIDTLLCAGTYDCFIARFNGLGTPVWATSFGSSGDERGLEITTDMNTQSVYVAGTFYNALVIGLDTLSYAGGAYSDMFVAKYDGNGFPLWAMPIGGTYLDEPTGLAVDTQGSLFLCGSMYSSTITIGSDVLNNSGTSFYCDILVAKFDAAGIPQWADAWGVATGNDIVKGIAVDAANLPYITGIHGNNIMFGSYQLSGTGAFVVMYDVTGSVWAAEHVTSAYGTCIAGGFSTDVVVGGILYDPSATFGIHTINNAGMYDAFAARLDLQSGLNEAGAQADVKVYPNPTTGIIQFNGLSPDETYDVRITNLLGEVVKTTTLSPGEVQMNLGELERGVYFITALGSSSESVVAQKIILE